MTGSNTGAQFRINGSQLCTVRPLQVESEKELSATVSLINKCYRSTGNWTNEAEILDGLRITPENLKKEAMCYDVFVVEEEQSEDLIACVQTGIVTETVVGPLPEPTGYVGMLSVADAFQSRGLGTKLMRFVEKHCCLLGAEKVSMVVLEVREDVLAWYERCGYKRTGHSVDSAPFFENKGEILLKPSNFVLLQKPLASS